MSNYEDQLIDIIKNDSSIMSILEAVEELNLSDAWVSAGLIRNKVWDVLHNINTPINDIDVIYFDSTDTSWDIEKSFEQKLEALLPNQPWSVKNQARMHMKNSFAPYTSSYDGVAHFTEIPTAIAVRLQKSELEVMAPYGLEDLFNKIVRPTPYFQKGSELQAIYIKRMQEKEWDKTWKDLSIRTIV
ncbi:nucleotidyltransferase family protein [Lysinibacillus sp. NPDC097287]|uniref:nucleotidyltransferase family protein n=1 Tax=Lysinibacillus sp. NPDC097287 TaxID=3364144 RepID=UPI003821D739